MKRQLTALAAVALSLTMQWMTASTPAYLDPSLPARERAADLCSRLTPDEKVKLMMNSSPAIERLGIPAFEWWSEGLHGVARNGVATVFPSCIGMAASFDDDLIEQVFAAVSDEARAKNNIARANGVMGKYKGLSLWTPTVNIFRDPRWGRGQESYGEDPYMNGRMGKRVVRGLQGEPRNGYYKVLACAKHLAVHSGPEKTRHSMNIAGLPPRDLWESYLPAFKDLVTGADVREVMCAYQRFEGEACCGSDRLLNRILRNQWGFDGVVVSDCGAINDFYLPGRHGVAADAPAASALGVRSGTDVECGAIYRKLPEALSRGDITMEEIDRSVKRLLTARFLVGDMTPDSLVAWTAVSPDTIACASHRALARKMAREQMVLLKDNGILPLDPRKSGRVAVMGPNATDSTMQWGIYYGFPRMTVTTLQGLTRALGYEPVYVQGCGITSPTERRSVFASVTGCDGKPGFEAEYWNNLTMEGTPAATARYTSPLHLDNGGNTVFAPGVELENFTMRMRGSLVADADETLYIDFTNDDGLRIIVNGDTVHNRWKAEALTYRDYKLKVEKGRRYDIEIDYMQLADDATLNVDINRLREGTTDEIIARLGDAETVIFAGGISPALEREQAKVREPGFDNGDRTSIELPKCQRDLIKALKQAGKKVVLVNFSGSAVALSSEDGLCDAIVQAWYPGEEGGNALAEVLTGAVNPSGKLPVTFYSGDDQLPAFDDYTMKGRTYRYMRGVKPLYPFGHGLSYTTFDISSPRYADGKVSVDVTNTGRRAGTETVQLYLRRDADTEGPDKTLRGYARVDLRPGESRTVVLDMPREAFETWDDESGTMRTIGGSYTLMAGNSSDDSALSRATVTIE